MPKQPNIPVRNGAQCAITRTHKLKILFENVILKMRISIGDSRQEPSSWFVLDRSLLPGTRIELTELCGSGNVRVKSAVYVDDLTRNISALIGSKVYTHISDILRTTIAINHNVACEDVLNSLRNICLVLGSNDKTRSYAVATDILLAVLKSCCLCEKVNACLSASISK